MSAELTNPRLAKLTMLLEAKKQCDRMMDEAKATYEAEMRATYMSRLATLLSDLSDIYQCVESLVQLGVLDPSSSDLFLGQDPYGPNTRQCGFVRYNMVKLEFNGRVAYTARLGYSRRTGDPHCLHSANGRIASYYPICVDGKLHDTIINSDKTFITPASAYDQLELQALVTLVENMESDFAKINRMVDEL